MLAKRRWARNACRRLKIHDLRETTRHDAGKAKPSITTPTVTKPPKDAIFCDAGKPTTSVATPLEDDIFGTDELQDAIEHGMENRRQASPAVAASTRRHI
jgi:hypothetical protein